MIAAKPKAHGIIFVHPNGRVEKFRDNHDGTFTDQRGHRVHHPVAPKDGKTFLVLDHIDERAA